MPSQQPTNTAVPFKYHESFPRKRLKYLVSSSISGEVIDQSWWHKGAELLFTCSKLPMASNYSEFPAEKRTTSSDLLITRNATPYVFLPPPGSIYSNVVQRISLTVELLPQFGLYALQAAADSDMVGYGVSIPSFNYGKWTVLPVSVPPLDTQAKIASYLDYKIGAIDAAIDQAKQQLEHVKAYRFSVIQEALMPFPRKRLKYLVSASISGEVIDQSWWNKGTELLFTCSKLPMASNYSQFPSKKRTTSSDLLITRNATPYVFLPPLGSIYSNVVQRISLTADLLPQFGVYALQSAADSDMVGYGVSIPSFNYGKWAVLPVSVPSLPVQAEIAAFLDQKISAIDRTIATLQQLLTALPLYRQSLISDVVTGQVSVPDAFTAEPTAMLTP